MVGKRWEVQPLKHSTGKFVILDKVTIMIIERTKNEIIFRLPGDIKIDELQELTDWFRYLEVIRNFEYN